MHRFEKLKIASTKALAIFFFISFASLAQTGQLKLYVYDKPSNSMLRNWKMKVFVDDSLCKDVNASDANGLILLSKIKAGTHSILLRPENHPDQRTIDLEVFADSTNYFTFSITPKPDRPNGKH